MLNQKNPFLCTICVTAQASGLVIPQTLCVDKISLRFSLGTNFAAKKPYINCYFITHIYTSATTQ